MKVSPSLCLHTDSVREYSCICLNNSQVDSRHVATQYQSKWAAATLCDFDDLVSHALREDPGDFLKFHPH